jgi:DNA-binding CsgD family transcriptional regulator
MQSRHELRERILGAESIGAAVNVLAEVLSQIGISSFATGYVAGAVHEPSGQWRKFEHQVINFPKGWDDAWHLFSHHCPYYHACFDGRVGFDWATVRTRDVLTEHERKAWRYLADFGLIQGFRVPIHSPGHFGFVTVVGEAHDLSWAGRAEANVASLLFFSHVYYEAVRERFPEVSQPSQSGLLSARERECLGWVAAGKTTDEVATILGLSIETVRIYLKRTMRKLDANTRSQAVAKAYRMGLFERR